jgi:hypothetical protein
MTDTTTKPETGSTEDTFAWTEPEQASTTGGQQAREWLSQLQGMIENLATQAAPVVREVGAKAAELAAIAGEKAGPLAQRAASFTENAGHKLAERSRDLAVDLRSQAAAAKAATGTAAIDDVAAPTTEPMTAEPMTAEPMTADESTSMADEHTTSGVA